MRIISQDSKLSVEFSNVALKLHDNNICSMDKDTSYIIGRYATEDRAKEVFKEIHREFVNELLREPYVKIYKMPGE